MHNEENTRINDERRNKPCLNCDATLFEDATHCHSCGQAIKDARMTVRALMSNFLSNLFNLDGKIWRTLRHMWKPAYLTKEYVSGKRMRYFNPARFFAITLILHFILLTYSMSHSDLGLDSLNDIENITKSELVTQYDTIATQLIPQADSIQIDTLRRTLFGNVKRVEDDTLFYNVILYTDLSKYGILRKDAYTLSSKELYKKYEITGWWEQLFIRQTVRINKNKESTLTYIIGNLSWVVILVVFFIAMIMKLLYVRGSYYYVEHAVLMMLVHAKTFFVINTLMIIMICLPDMQEDLKGGFTTTAYILAVLYLFITLKMYYQQGWFKTILKFAIIGITYMIAMLFFMTIVSIIGAAIF